MRFVTVATLLLLTVLAIPTPAAAQTFLAIETFAYHPAFTGGVHVGSCATSMGVFVVTGAAAGGGPHVRVWRVSYSAIYEVTVVAEWMAYPVAFTGGVSVGCADFGVPGYLAVHTAPASGYPPLLRVWLVEP